MPLPIIIFAGAYLVGRHLAGGQSDSNLGGGAWRPSHDPNYPCANPDGPVYNTDCPDDDPLCNCPCQELKPTNENFEWFSPSTWFGDPIIEEPTDGELQNLLEELKECELIEEYLGEEYLGCSWTNPDHPSSCNCPCRGEKYNDYVEYIRTYATYWDTDKHAPLWREAQMALINAQKAVIVLNGDLTLRPGKMIKLFLEEPEAEGKQKRMSGRWLVAGIEHIISAQSAHRMIVTLTRDSTTIDPDASESWWETGWEALENTFG